MLEFKLLESVENVRFQAVKSIIYLGSITIKELSLKVCHDEGVAPLAWIERPSGLICWARLPILMFDMLT